jgi:hypothetical protein
MKDRMQKQVLEEGWGIREQVPQDSRVAVAWFEICFLVRSRYMLQSMNRGTSARLYTDLQDVLQTGSLALQTIAIRPIISTISGGDAT